MRFTFPEKLKKLANKNLEKLEKLRKQLTITIILLFGIFLILLLIISPIVKAEEDRQRLETEMEVALPIPNEKGDYFGVPGHYHWEVIDPDVEGLMGRRAYDFPLGFSDLRCKYNKRDFAM